MFSKLQKASSRSSYKRRKRMKKENHKRKELPMEVMEEILLRLPVKSLLRSKCVCKSWLSLIINLRFIKAHLSQSIENNSKLILASRCNLHFLDVGESDNPGMDEFDYLPFNYCCGHMTLIGSCNGLVCLYERISSTKVTIHVWNPATSERIKLLYVPPKHPNIPDFTSTDFEFGYAPATDEYKVVVFAHYYGNRYHRTDVVIRTLGMNTWRTIPNVPYSPALFCEVAELNGALHWLATHKEWKDMIYFILSFDLANEKFQELRLPDFGDNYRSISLKITVMGGRISVFCHFLHKDCFEMWVMNDYGNEQSWTKQFSDKASRLIEYIGQIRPLGFRRNGEILLEKSESQLELYDPANKRIRNLHIHDKPYIFKARTYVESLVSLGVSDDVEKK